MKGFWQSLNWRHAFFLMAVFLPACELDRESVSPPSSNTVPLLTSPGLSFHSVAVDYSGFSPDFYLKDANGVERTLADWRGKVVLLFFGYTHCPDVCPTTLSTLIRVMEVLEEEAKNVQVIFVTLDPARDTPKVLREYPIAFHPDFIGLGGKPEEVQKLARNFRMFYRVNPGRTHNIYTIDHSVQVYAYDMRGRLRLLMSDQLSPEAMADDILTLLKEGRGL